MSNDNTPKTPTPTPTPARTVIREVREGNTRSEEPTAPPRGRPDIVNKSRSEVHTPRTNIQENNKGGTRGDAGGGSQKTKR